MHTSVSARDAALVRQLCLKIAVHLCLILVLSAWLWLGLPSPTFLWSPPAPPRRWSEAGSRIQLGFTQPCPDCERISCSGGEGPSWQTPHLSSRERSNPVCEVVSGEHTCPLVPNNEHNQMRRENKTSACCAPPSPSPRRRHRACKCCWEQPRLGS